MYPPCSAFETWFVSAALDDAAFDRIAAALPGAARAAAEARACTTDKTIVHVMRHGEVYNPDKVLYGRLPDYHLSDKGRAQAQAVADWLASRDITYVVASPLERAQETAAPIAERHGLPIDIDDDLIESANIFQGQKVSPGDGALRDPRNWWYLGIHAPRRGGSPMTRSRSGWWPRWTAPVSKRQATRRFVSAISCRWRRCGVL